MMTFKVVDPGLFSTVQDAGRTGYQAYGFSPSGAMDYRAHKLVNKLLGNDENAAVLEMTLHGVTLEVLKETVIATAGAEAEIMVDDVSYGSGLPIRVMRGERLKIGKCQRGARIYLGVAGGFDVPEVLGSRSTHTRSGIGGFKGRTLKAGDVLRTVGGEFQNTMKKIKSFEEDDIIRIIPGQQYERFSDDAREKLFNSGYEITKDSDRMGFRLSGPELTAEDGHDVLSEPTQLGSIQVPKNGQPIILLNDRQTAGGYARIATVALADIPKLVQKPPGEKIIFKEIDVDEAAEEYKKELERIRSGEYFEPLTDFTSVRRRTALKITKLMGV
ncbi:biotin-dependent carboxyltransferase family protein [Salinicoccus halitifaciens]|uniref:Antagonist of KipI n=1 Tax=Salinicoccus halitifaciens TaxID=1073415 RepID=A0ABV2EAH9_9STAP|nr:biotin-dependent carboxyltransferase family protein [Salinicoccus halitifaciens]MCD2138566.1 biotin-dependent carboxyltransferase family protein [Salinicoccus halitifaciens]